MSIQMQENIVKEVVDLAPEGWGKITVNIEIAEIADIDGNIVVSPKSKCFIRNVGYELRLGIDAVDYFEELQEIMKKNDSENRPWTICDLEILNSGAFNFKFSYNEPPRLSDLK